jgi:hypothetical protein
VYTDEQRRPDALGTAPDGHHARRARVVRGRGRVLGRDGRGPERRLRQGLLRLRVRCGHETYAVFGDNRASFWELGWNANILCEGGSENSKRIVAMDRGVIFLQAALFIGDSPHKVERSAVSLKRTSWPLAIVGDAKPPGGRNDYFLRAVEPFSCLPVYRIRDSPCKINRVGMRMTAPPAAKR